MFKIKKILIAFFIISILPGCAYLQYANRSHLRQTGDDSGMDEKYYHFTKSQIELRNNHIDQAIYHMQEALKSDPESLYLKRELAFLYVEKEDYKSALDVFTEIIKKDPNNVEALIMFGKIKQAQKAYDEAIQAYSKVLTLDKKQHDIYLLLGGLYLERKDMDTALSVFHQMSRQYPDSYTAYYFRGKIYEEQGNFTLAEKQFIKTLTINPDLDESKFELANIYQQEKFRLYTVKPGDTLEKISKHYYKKFNKDIEYRILSFNPEINNSDDLIPGQKLSIPFKSYRSKLLSISAVNRKKIIRLYKEILKNDSQNIRAQMELAYFYDRINMKAEAEKLYAKLGERSQDEPGIIVLLFNQYVDRNQYHAAIDISEGALKGAPNSSGLHHIAGLAYESVGEYEKALLHFQQVSEESRFYDDAVVQISYIYQQTGQTEKGIAFLQKTIKKYPENSEYMLFLGSLYEDIEDYSKAEEILKRGISIDKKNIKLLFRLGVVYDKWGKKKACIKILKRVIALDPKHASALNYLGYTYAEMGENLDEAEQLILEALKYKPNDGYITDSLGWVYYKKGLFSKAVEVLEKAVALIPDDPTMLEHLGDAHFKLNNKTDALKFYKMSLEKISQNEKNKKTLEKKIQDLKDQGF